MSKSITNQRLIYKINSSRFRYNDWDLNITFAEAKRNEEIVSLGDSETLRMIRLINKNNITEEEINELKSKFNKLREKPNTDSNIHKISKAYKELVKSKMIDDYLIIVFETTADWNKANSKNTKVKFNGKIYKRLLGTSGGIKKNSVVFCSTDVYDNLEKRLNNGRDLNKIYIPAKFESYKSLACSCSTPVTQPKRVLVIKDGEVNIKANVLRLSGNKDVFDKFDLTEVDDYEIKRAFTDGCGMISPKLSEQWGKDFNEDYIPTGFNIRNSWTKGMVFTFPFVEYADSIGEYMVEDAWGNIIDIREVDLIITTNMLKLWDAYKSYEHYLECCKENGFQYSVAKILPQELESVRNMNYQFLQSYELTDEEIYELIKPTVDNIKGALGINQDDYGKALLFLKGTKITEKDFKNDEFNYMKALMINKEMINDPFIKQKIHKMIKKKIDDSKKGVIQINGNYSIISGDLYALCQHMFKKEVTGLLKANEFYAKTWLDKGVNEIVAYRAPMTIHNNIKKMKLINNKEVNKWYRYMKVCTVLNAWDTTMDAMNGADMDGDAIITTDNKILLKNTIDLKTVVCEQSSAEKKKITEALLRKANKNGFDNDVGGVTNRCTGMFEVLAKFKKGSKEYNEMMYRITCMQGYQQEIIDSCKGIIPKQVPKEWYDYKAVKILDDDSEEVVKKKLFNQRLLANKKPYFFIYNYKHLKSKYDKYIKVNNDNCLIRFGLTVGELKNKEYKSSDEELFLYYYDMQMPIVNNGSTMSRICNMLEEEFNGVAIHVKRNDLFDKSILMTNKKVNKALQEKLKELHKEYQKEVYSYMANNNITKTDKRESRQMLNDNFIEKVYSICNNSEDVCNALVDMLYDSPNSKQFVWDICGDYIVEKLLKEGDNKISFPVKDNNGDIEWNGERYQIRIMEVEVDN